MINEVFGLLMLVCATTWKAGVGASVGLCGKVRWLSVQRSRDPPLSDRKKIKKVFKNASAL